MTQPGNTKRPDGGRTPRKTRRQRTLDNERFEVVAPKTIGQLRAMKVGRVELDLDGRRVLIAGRQLLLRPKEFLLLQCLMEHAGAAVDRQYLLDQVWGTDFDLDPKTLTVHVMRLRKQLIEHGAGDCIQTVRGQGYAFLPKAGPR